MLQTKISHRTALIGVIGLGYVGLPLAVLSGQHGYYVRGIDQDKGRAGSVLAGKSYITDIDDEEILSLVRQNKLQISTDYADLKSCDIIAVCVPTPLTPQYNPDYSYLESAVRGIAAALRRGQLIIVESTVAPGTTSGMILPLLEATGLRVGRDFYLSYSPERIDPGNKNYSLHNIQKLVSGLTSMCQSLASRFYEKLGITAVPVPTVVAAEMAKLLENTYRDINIAFINEMAQVCRRQGIDIWEVIAAASTKPFGFQSFYPGPGVGGHCIPVDSIYYTSWARANGTAAELAEHARRVNAGRPLYIKGIVAETLQAAGKTLFGSKILVLGVTYKKDIADMRESPALKLIDLLREEGADVSFHDPSVEKIRSHSEELQRIGLHEDTLAAQDCVVLAVAHSAYNPAWLYANSRVIVDLANGFAGYAQDKITKL